MEKRYFFGLFFFCVAIVGSQCQVSLAAIYGLEVFTSNGYYYDNPGLDLYVDVTPDGDQVRFEFRNDSTLASSIEGIYFDDGSLFGIAYIDEGAGTSFSQGASPPNLPAGEMLVPPFETSQGFLSDSDPPASGNGVNPGEWLAIVFDLLEGKTLGNVLDELNDDTLRVGIHVISLPDGSSESAVTPEPVTLIFMGLGGWTLLRRRR